MIHYNDVRTLLFNICQTTWGLEGQVHYTVVLKIGH